MNVGYDIRHSFEGESVDDRVVTVRRTVARDNGVSHIMERD